MSIGAGCSGIRYAGSKSAIHTVHTYSHVPPVCGVEGSDALPCWSWAARYRIGIEAWVGCASQALRLQQVVRQLSLLCGLVGCCVTADLLAQRIWQSTGHTAIASVLLAYRETVHALQTNLLVCRTGRLLDGGSLREICTWEVSGWHQPVPSEACCDEKLTPPV